jgi:hypothetical protein
VKSNVKNNKQYQLLADTREERDQWVATISGAPDSKPHMQGTLLKKGGAMMLEWEERKFSATFGTLAWDDEDSDEEEIDETAAEVSLSAKRLYTRLHEISGLSKRDVKAMVRLLDGNVEDQADDDDDDDDGDGAVSREEFESGLTRINQLRLDSNESQELESRGSKAILRLLGGELNFYETLFAICERKTGKPLPNTNFACRQAKIALGVRMPSIKKRVWATMKMDAMKMSPQMHHALAETADGDPQ